MGGRAETLSFAAEAGGGGEEERDRAEGCAPQDIPAEELLQEHEREAHGRGYWPGAGGGGMGTSSVEYFPEGGDGGILGGGGGSGCYTGGGHGGNAGGGGGVGYAEYYGHNYGGCGLVIVQYARLL